MSWLWIKFLAPKPLKFPQTNTKIWILFSYAHFLMHIFPMEMHDAFIVFSVYSVIYKEVSFQLLSGQLLQNKFVRHSTSFWKTTHLHHFTWHSSSVCPQMSQLMEPRASQIKAWAPLCFQACKVRQHSSEAWIHLRTTCAAGAAVHLPWKHSSAVQLAKSNWMLKAFLYQKEQAS